MSEELPPPEFLEFDPPVFAYFVLRRFIRNTVPITINNLFNSNPHSFLPLHCLAHQKTLILISPYP